VYRSPLPSVKIGEGALLRFLLKGGEVCTQATEESAAQLLSFKWSRCRTFVGSEVKSHPEKRGK